MEVPRELLNRLFRDTRFPLVRHHLDSYDDFLEKKLPTYLKATNPLTLQLGDARVVKVYLGGKDANVIRYVPIQDELGHPILPHMCRLDRDTYSLEVRVQIDVEYTVGQRTLKSQIDNFLLARLPLMLRSKYCYLTYLEPEKAFEAGECRYELGGYFVIDGAERALLVQEVLGNNMEYVRQRSNMTSDATGKRTLVERAPAFKVDKPEYINDRETVASIRSVSEDGAIGPYSHSVILPPETESHMKRVALVQLPSYDQPVPLFAVFECLGVVTDKDLYDVILAGIPDSERADYDKLFTELVISYHSWRGEMSASEMLKTRTRNQSESQVLATLHREIFPHVESRGDDNAGLFRRKAYALGRLTRMTFDLALGKIPKSDRDHFKYKRLDCAGDLYFQQFKRTYKEVARRMITEMDKRLTYEATNYAGEKIQELLQPETIGAFWSTRQFLEEFEKAHKSTWGGVTGVSQELSRLSFYSTLSMLRRVSLQMDSTLNIAEPRRLHGSQYGLMCPSDSPDGKSIGFIKAFTILARVSTPFPVERILKILEDSKQVLRLADIHPAAWNPSWTRITVNTDLVGLIPGDTEALHRKLVQARRSGEIDRSVSLGWNRLNNEYTILCDAGRPVRPIYREGVSPDRVIEAATWEKTEELFDWIDPQEMDTVRIAMESYHPKLPSEIHPLFNFSPSTAVIPFSDHNAGTRNNFSAAQQMKQACGWYHTNFNKRFDTIATLLNTPQRPLSQTWVYPHVFGCMPYGVNVMVAIMIYGGFNQEDSVLVNQGSLKRGLFDTTYYHSYRFEEELLDVGLQTHTEVANPTLPKWEEVKRNPDADYSKLDADGIIRVGEIVDPKTVLLGVVSPVLDEGGVIQTYRDVSVLPKRGQRGRVDAVYRYRTPTIRRKDGTLEGGLLGVRIRISERRTPTLGDKFASRHGQKGTIGAIVPEEDFPFTASGVRPDVIVNPHAIPTRMTVGQLLESTCNKLGVKQGALTDATPFTVSRRIPDTAQRMVEAGFESYGNEVLYNGQTGEMFDADIFMGPTFYMRLKQMVEDKINYRDTGARQLLTHQPPQGRDAEGGLRIGEMERDVLLAHGISAFAQESMMKRSDGEEMVYQPETGKLTADMENIQSTLEMPYSMKLFTQEVQAMHVSMTLATSYA